MAAATLGRRAIALRLAAMAAVFRGHVAEHLLDMHAAARKGGLTATWTFYFHAHGHYLLVSQVRARGARKGFAKSNQAIKYL
jgi:hypothetical protein